MKYLFDSSILISSFIQKHPKHSESFTWLQKAIKNEIEFYVSSHSIFEVYSVLTRLPLQPKISSSMAKRLIESNIKKCAKIILLSESEIFDTLEGLSRRNLIGGIVYDAIIFSCAQKSKVNQILTLNPKDFNRLKTENDDIRIIEV